MAAEAGRSQGSELDLEETELKLAPPGRRTSADGERKRGFSEVAEPGVEAPSSTAWTSRCVEGSSGSAVSKPSGSAKPAAKAQIVGWPPVRSFQQKALKRCSFVKVAVDGAPYLRKVDLEIYSGYQELWSELEKMFSCFATRNHSTERKLVDSVNGKEFVPTYEDKDGDWMLVGDVPWKMFVESCRRLRLMKSSEAVNLGNGCFNPSLSPDHSRIPRTTTN